MQIRSLIYLSPIFFALSCIGGLQDGVTMDEPHYLGAGHALFNFSVIHLNAFHPILIKYFVGMATNLIPTVEPVNGLSPAVAFSTVSYAHLWLAENTDRLMQLFWTGRFVVIVINSLLLGYALLLARRIFGYRTTLISAILLIFSPLFLGNARYIALDVSCTLLIFITSLHFAEYFTERSVRTLTVSFLFLLLCLLSKFQSLALLPALFCAGCVIHFKDQRALLKSLVGLTVAICLAFGSIGVIYNAYIFNAPAHYQEGYQRRLKVEGPKIFYYIADALTPYPVFSGLRWYFTGAVSSANFTQRDKPITVLLGDEEYVGGRAEYFPFLFLFKESLPFQALLLIGLLSLFWRDRRVNLEDMKPAQYASVVVGLVFLLLYGSIALTSRLNIGLRHVLPLYPFIIFLTVFLGLEKRGSNRLVVPLLALHMISAIAAFPHMLSFTNQAAKLIYGDSIFISDANFDWGQDNLRLHNRLKDLGVSTAFQSVTSPIDLNWYGKDVVYQNLQLMDLPIITPGSYCAIALQFLEKFRRAQNRSLETADFLQTLNLEYVETVGDTIGLYRKVNLPSNQQPIPQATHP